MPAIAALSAAALLASLSAPLETPPDVPGLVSFAAGSSRWSGETGRYEFEDGVILRRGAVVVRARSATFDPATDEVVADGDVLLVDDTRALHADHVRAVLNGPFQAEGVAAALKEGHVDLTRAGSYREARAAGKNRAFVRGSRVDGDAEGRLRVSDARVTLCDCGADRAPSWELRARDADVIPGKRATFSWPVVYVTPRILGVQKPVPILAAPWLYLPLGERQSGILFPELGRTSTTGFYYAQPLYLVLGRSADATITPEYFFGPSDPHRAGGAVAGPGARLELRWAPAVGAEGELRARWVYDLDHDPNGASGSRISIAARHGQNLGPDTRLRVRLALEGDEFLVRDFGSFSPGYFPGNAYYTKSEALLSHRGGPLVLELSTAYLEPLLPTVPRAQVPASFVFGPFGSRVPTIQRWPSASATLVPVRLGPLLLQGRAGVSRLAPIQGDRGELAPNDPGANPTPPADVFAASERAAVTRGEARAELSLPLALGGAASVSPFVRGAALGYAFDGGGALASTAWAMAGLSARTELSRRYGAGLHRIAPEVDLLAGTGVARSRGGDPFPAYDLLDRSTPPSGAAAPVQRLQAAPPGAYTQLRAGLDNALEAGSAGRLQLGLTQDFDLRGGKLAESTVTFSGSRGLFAASTRLSVLAVGGRPPRDPRPEYRSALDAFTRFDAYAGVHDRRGDALNAGFSSVGPGGVGAQAAGLDALFDLRPGTGATGASINLNGKAQLSGAHLSYVAVLAARRTDIPCGGGTVAHRDAGGLEKQTAELIWDSPCHCFTAGVKLSYDACGSLGTSLEFDLSRLMQGARTR